ncbi:MAG: hypothetical protein HFF81_03800 [Oscillospiraceae bacterium]|jgi:hypothetical protein|nr:hypothetical protein [Oscillospiraceae bacterium]
MVDNFSVQAPDGHSFFLKEKRIKKRTLEAEPFTAGSLTEARRQTAGSRADTL